MKPHYERIRKVKTRNGATAIQVGNYKGKSFKLTKHIGSSKDTQKVKELEQIAQEYIRSHSPQLVQGFAVAQGGQRAVLTTRSPIIWQILIISGYRDRHCDLFQSRLSKQRRKISNIGIMPGTDVALPRSIWGF